MNFPKWPGCEIRGKSVTVDQAAEIIIRTDDLYISCNDQEWTHILNKEMGVAKGDYDSVDKARDTYHNLELYYFCNDRIASCYIGGPNGWCNWDGTIHLSGKNIGKWPNLEALLEELNLIAKNFTYLDFKCQLFDNEFSEDKKGIVEFTVKDGSVTYTEEFTPFETENKDIDYARLFSDRYGRGCSVDQFRRGLALAKDSTYAQYLWLHPIKKRAK